MCMVVEVICIEKQAQTEQAESKSKIDDEDLDKHT